MSHNQTPSQTKLALAALGIVFGDIGTSPLYAIRESLSGFVIDRVNVLGVLSLIFWTLAIIIALKYLFLVFQADNKGEGGILALLALIKGIGGKSYKYFFILGVFGAGLLLGDGMLTPAISVVSAIEGLNVILPEFSSWIFPLSCLLLMSLFLCQSFGTSGIGMIFGPIIFIWFITIAALGIGQITTQPTVLYAVNPEHAINFLVHNGFHSYAMLGGIFLVVTGGEALFADIGHLGKTSIRISWFAVVFPCLIINYFGQGAYLMSHPEAIANPFYAISPRWFFIPLLVIATLATIIASQAVISAAFSLTKQAVLLGLYPHLPIVQTSQTEKGQIYVPQINFILAVGTMSLVVFFKTSDAIAHAYGIAVNIDMILTTIMVMYIAHHKWRWHIAKLAFVFTIFMFVDLSFFGANLQKIPHGGWVPLVFAVMVYFVILTWTQGMRYLRQNYYLKREELSFVVEQLKYEKITILENTTAIFVTDLYDYSGGGLIHFLKLSHALPERTLIVNYQVEDIPHVMVHERFIVKKVSEHICQLTIRYGFTDDVSIPRALVTADKHKILPFRINTDSVTYLLEVPNIIASRHKKTLWFHWQEEIFAYIMRNYSANLNIDFYKLPFDKTIVIGVCWVI